MSSRTYLLAGGAFAVGTSGYIVTGVLPAVSRELHVSQAAAGQLVTTFAIAYAVASPLLAVATGRWERRKLLVAALVLSAAGNAVGAVAPSFELLLASRVISALGAAVFTPVATSVATALVPADHRGRAVATVFAGLTFALIIGVPLGSVVGEHVGYRGVFLMVAAVSLVAAAAVTAGVPRVSAPPAAGLRERFAVTTDRTVQLVLGMTVLGCLAAFAVFTYLAPILSTVAGVHGSAISLLLLVYGVGGAIGNSLGGRAADRWGSRAPLLVIFVVFTAVLVTLPVTATGPWTAGAVLFVWGLFTWSVNPPIQSWLLELAPNAASGGLLLSMNASAIYLGVGLSGVLGGVVVSTAGLLALPLVSAAIAAGALLLLVLASRVPQPVPVG